MYLIGNKSDLIDKSADFTNSKKVFERGISLPSAYNLEEKDLQYICKVINKF